MPDGPQPTYEGTSSTPATPHKGVTSAGLDCLTESMPDGYGKLLTRPLGLEGDINDARPPNSTVLEWYYQLSARWVPKLECSEYPLPSDDDDTKTPIAEHNTEATSPTAAEPINPDTKKKGKAKVPSAVYPRPKAMSFHNFAGPGDLNDKQSSFVFTYQVTVIRVLYSLTRCCSYLNSFLQAPTDVESIFWYTGRMHHSGTLLRLKQHAHNIIYKESLVFAASPAQLGLTAENDLVPAHPYMVVRTKDAGFANNVELKRFILATLEKSHEKFDGECVCLFQ